VVGQRDLSPAINDKSFAVEGPVFGGAFRFFLGERGEIGRSRVFFLSDFSPIARRRVTAH